MMRPIRNMRDQRTPTCDMRSGMYQTVALLGDISAGLRGRDHHRGGVLYAVRDGATFLYIGKTIKSIWPHIRNHLRSEDALGRAARAEAPLSAHWQVEVCIVV